MMDAATCPECGSICAQRTKGEKDNVFVCTICERPWFASQLNFAFQTTSEKSEPTYEDIKKGSRPDTPFIVQAVVKGYRCAKCKRVETPPSEVIEVRKGQSSIAKSGSTPNGWKSVDWDVWLCPTDWEAFKLAFAEWCNSTKVIASLGEIVESLGEVES